VHQKILFLKENQIKIDVIKELKDKVK
jgi:hypothetical protein